MENINKFSLGILLVILLPFYSSGQGYVDCTSYNNTPYGAEPAFIGAPIDIYSGNLGGFTVNAEVYYYVIHGNVVIDNIEMYNGSKIKILNTDPNATITIKNLLIDGNSRLYIGTEGSVKFEGGNQYTNPVTGANEAISITNNSIFLVNSWKVVAIGDFNDSGARIGIANNSAFRVYSCKDIALFLRKVFVGQCWQNTASCPGENTDSGGNDRSEFKLIAAQNLSYTGSEIHRRNRSMSVSSARSHLGTSISSSNPPSPLNYIRPYPYPTGQGQDAHVFTFGGEISLQEFIVAPLAALDGDVFQSVYMIFSALFAQAGDANANACPDLCFDRSVAWNYRVPGDNLYPSLLPLVINNSGPIYPTTNEEFELIDQPVTIFPNPISAGGLLSIQVGTFENTGIRNTMYLEMFDLTGKKILSRSFPDIVQHQLIQFDIDKEIPEGQYIVSVVLNKSTYTNKIVISN